MSVEIARPYPPEHLPMVWAWLHDYQQETLDDRSPATVEELIAKYHRDESEGSVHYAVFNGHPVPSGIVWFEASGDGLFVGHLVFDRRLPPHDKAEAVTKSLRDLFASDARKVYWMSYEDNPVFVNFLRKRVGAKVEGVLERHARRNGGLVDVIMLASFPEDLNGQE